VREAESTGIVELERLEAYQKLEKEAHSFEVRHDEGLRRKEDRAWGEMISEHSKRVKRWKGR
jgi:hypothetical protein